MFNIFGKSQVPPVRNPTPPDEQAEVFTPKEPEVNIYEHAAYTIGVNQHGMTQIVFRSETGSMTLSMDPTGVRNMIRMLEVTLPVVEDTDEEVEEE